MTIEYLRKEVDVLLWDIATSGVSDEDAVEMVVSLAQSYAEAWAKEKILDARLEEINRVVSHEYEHPSGRFIGRGKYYAKRTDELDTELRSRNHIGGEKS